MVVHVSVAIKNCTIGTVVFVSVVVRNTIGSIYILIQTPVTKSISVGIVER